MLISELPAAAKTVHRAAGTGAGTIYTVPDGQVLYVQSAWLVVIPISSNGASFFGIGFHSEDTGLLTRLLVLSYPTGTTRPFFLFANGLSQRVNSGELVSFLGSATNSTHAAGFTGFLI